MHNLKQPISTTKFRDVAQTQASVRELDRTSPTSRKTIFLSHANPEDNPFALWLATQLAIAGYEVWCDLTKLIGGEAFWRDISEIVNGNAFRFLFASTLESNRKPGTLRELSLALKAEEKHSIRDFIIPLKVDAFPFASAHSSIRERNFIRFDQGWPTGLAQLLTLLERQQAPKVAHSGPDAVSAWYTRTLDENRKTVVSNESCFSNWFSVTLPKQIYIHHVAVTPTQLALAARTLDIPCRPHGQMIIAFANQPTVEAELKDILTINQTQTLSLTRFIDEGNQDPEISVFDARNIVSDMIRQGWDATLRQMDMRSHLLASGLRAWFFCNDQIPSNRAYFVRPGENRRTYRQLVGRKSRRTTEGLKVPDGYWHYAVSASPQLVPFPKIVLRHHVIFTDDGQTPWKNAKRMHRARRRVCKNWWNREWRDRLFAMCAALASGDTHLMLPVSQDLDIRVSMTPQIYESPWTYYEDGQTGVDEEAEIELIEEQTVEDEFEDELNADVDIGHAFDE